MRRHLSDLPLHAGALAIGLAAAAMSGPLHPQIPDSGATSPPPRGPVTADCYARTEVWQDDVRTPVRLLFTRVAYNETTGAGVRFALASQWNKFIAPRLSERGQQPGQNHIVYCQYADAPANTELARWPSVAPAPEQVEWPGYSVRWEPVMSAQAADPVQPPAATMPVAPAMPSAQMNRAPAQAMTPNPGAAAGPSPTVAPAMPATVIPAPPPGQFVPQPASPAPAAAAVAAPLPVQAPLPADALQTERDESVQAQQANAVYGEILRNSEQHARAEQAKEDAYRQQMEAYQRQMAAAQATQRAYDEQQRQYQEQKAAYDAQFGDQKGK